MMNKMTKHLHWAWFISEKKKLSRESNQNLPQFHWTLDLMKIKKLAFRPLSPQNNHCCLISERRRRQASGTNFYDEIFTSMKKNEHTMMQEHEKNESMSTQHWQQWFKNVKRMHCETFIPGTKFTCYFGCTSDEFSKGGKKRHRFT